MFHLVRVAGIEVEEEIVIEDILAFDTLDDGWEEMILSTPQVELEIEEEESKILLPKPTVTEMLKTLQILSDFTVAEQLDEVSPLLSQMCKHLVKHRMQMSKTVTIDRFFHKTQ
jgi:ubiquinone biosynthesis protein COQ9